MFRLCLAPVLISVWFYSGTISPAEEKVPAAEASSTSAVPPPGRVPAAESAAHAEAASAAPGVEPLPRAHSHNDYEQTRPLTEALDCGFMSVEADVYLVDGELLVAHERKDVKPERTLRSLYLKPLAQRAAANDGRIYRGQGAVTLLIDFKTGAASTWSALKPQLEEFRDILTEFDGTHLSERAVTVVISGERPVKQLSEASRRLAFIDGRPADLEKNPPVTLVPWISSSWTGLFEWRGEGEFPAAEKQKFHDFTAKAHAQGRRVRFWGVPNEPFAWDILTAGGVDILGSDDLPKLRDYLLKPKSGN